MSSAVSATPTVASRTIRVWILPNRVGSTADLLSDGLVAGPLEPLTGRAERAEPLAETPPGEVVGDLLGGDLQAEEGVDAGEVAAQRRRARGVQRPVAVGGALDLEVPLDLEAADRV